MQKQLKILYVDDEPINLLLFENLFRKKFEVKQAKSGFEGLQVLAENPDVKVVVSDMNMPGMSGLEFIQKAKIDYPRIRFFVLTGYEITSEITRAMDTGLISRYFRKPFDTKEIENSIREEFIG